MNETKIEFTDEEFQYLEHLKFVYDATNKIFITRGFADYIPIGLIIVYMSLSTLDRKYHKDPLVFNAKCISIGKLLYQLINTYKMDLLDTSYNPIPSKTLDNHIKNIMNNKTDNYVGLLMPFVSFENLHNTLLEVRSISSNDNRIKAVIGLWNGIKDKGFSFDKEYKTNDTLYSSIEHLRIVKEPKQLTLPEQRQLVLKQYFKDNSLSLPVLVDTNNDVVKSMDDLWRNLSKIEPNLFIFHSSKSSKKAFFYCTGENKKLNKICAFSKNIHNKLVK
ncbi:hypothetical protein MNBD_GAMMA01-737 [hydrothermal vent metagenome]|uniref:Uncharacterized protein n=1 Tax=hydrothermal vent metagenome TaxID=652676 RepID=A0A3B0VDH1_9ZZZZ